MPIQQKTDRDFGIIGKYIIKSITEEDIIKHYKSIKSKVSCVDNVS